MTIWRLKRGADARFRQGHPWIYASELAHSAKEVRPGEVVELQDFQNHFLAYGYVNPNSQICFRRLSSRSKDKNVLSREFFVERLRAAREFRVQAGWSAHSHRWVFAENDGVPGLVIDAFFSGEAVGWLVVVQASTAGMDRAVPEIYSALQEFRSDFGRMTVVEAPSSKSRKLEGLFLGEKRVVSGGEGVNLEDCTIHLRHGLQLNCDLLRGQKTGFFLDQQANAEILRGLAAAQFAQGSEVVRVLDICCYVGQWAAHATQALQSVGRKVEVTLFDASPAALKLAASNLRRVGAQVTVMEGDALKHLSKLPEGQFDVVVCDPPAFVKKRADLEAGLKAYVKLNREAMRLVAPGGLFVASSCSGLVKAEDWRAVLMLAAQKAGRMYKQSTRGGHAPDHPVRAEFPEGEYLKCTLGRIDYPY
jgi:23S rRNA (cytosine1962-C5)-methyltransferase